MYLDEIDGDWLYESAAKHSFTGYCGKIGEFSDKCTVEEMMNAREHLITLESEFEDVEHNKSIGIYAVQDEQGNVVHKIYFVYDNETQDHNIYAVDEDGNMTLQSMLCCKYDGEFYYFFYDETGEEKSVIVWINMDYNSGKNEDVFLIVPMCKMHQSILGVKLDRELYLDKAEEIKRNIAKYGRDFDPNLVLEDRNTAA